MLRDDPVIEVFSSPDTLPNSIEGIDVENGEYLFCDERGQKYVGEVTRPSGWFKSEEIRLRPEGAPSISNVLELIDRAELIEPNDQFPDLESLRRYVLKLHVPQ